MCGDSGMPRGGISGGGLDGIEIDIGLGCRSSWSWLSLCRADSVASGRLIPPLLFTLWLLNSLTSDSGLIKSLTLLLADPEVGLTGLKLALASAGILAGLEAVTGLTPDNELTPESL